MKKKPEDISRSPTNGERVAAIILSLLIVVICGPLSWSLLKVGDTSTYVTFLFFGILALIGLVMFLRAAFTAPQALGPSQRRFAAWGQLIAGAGGVLLFFVVPGHTHKHAILLSGSIFFLASGAAALKTAEKP